MKASPFSKLLPMVFLTSSALILHPTLHADTTWTGADPGDNLFGTDANWSDDTPAVGENGNFDSAGATVVDFGADHTVGGVTFLPGAALREVTFNFQGWELTGDFQPNVLGEQTLVFNGGTRTDGVDTFRGTFNITNTFRVGSGDPDETTTMRLLNGVVVNLSDAHHFFGNSGTFDIVIREGSELLNDPGLARMDIGRGTGATATMTVSGVGSRVDNANSGNGTGNNRVGTAGAEGTLTVEDGAWFRGGRRLKIGDGGIGTLIVRDSGLDENENPVFSTVTDTSAHAGLFLRGTRNGSAASGTAYALFQDGGQGLFGRALAVWDGGTMEIDRGLVSVAGDAQEEPRIFDSGSEIIYWLYNEDKVVGGVGNPRIDINADFVINDSILTIELGTGFAAQEGDEFFLLRHTGSDLMGPVDGFSGSGIFMGLSEGAAFWVGNTPFEISYAMGTEGDMVGLTVIPEPRTALLIGFSLLLLFLNRRSLISRRGAEM